jgi:hypothetical protein
MLLLSNSAEYSGYSVVNAFPARKTPQGVGRSADGTPIVRDEPFLPIVLTDHESANTELKFTPDFVAKRSSLGDRVARNRAGNERLRAIGFSYSRSVTKRPLASAIGSVSADWRAIRSPRHPRQTDDDLRVLDRFEVANIQPATGFSVGPSQFSASSDFDTSDVTAAILCAIGCESHEHGKTIGQRKRHSTAICSDTTLQLCGPGRFSAHQPEFEFQRGRRPTARRRTHRLYAYAHGTRPSSPGRTGALLLFRGEPVHADCACVPADDAGRAPCTGFSNGSGNAIRHGGRSVS